MRLRTSLVASAVQRYTHDLGHGMVPSSGYATELAENEDDVDGLESSDKVSNSADL